MKAAVVRDFTKSLSLEDVPKPEPGAGEVLVKVETCGPVPHRHPRGPRRLAGQADPAVHPWSRGCGDRRAGRAGRQHAEGRRPGRHAVARRRMRSLRLLRRRVGDAV